MKLKINLAAIFFLSVLLLNCVSSKEYHEMTYHEIVSKFYSLNKQYPHLLNVESAHSKYGIPHQAGRCGPTKCVVILATVTDKTFHNEYKPQVYLSGTVHGNERLGANVVTYLTEYLLTRYDTDPFVKQLLREREIIITPFVNAQGYYHNQREEMTDIGQYFDINRDFPYNRDSGDNQCFSTVGARITSKIFQNNLLVGWLSYHAGQQTIGYPWGSYNHVAHSSRGKEVATKTPDDSMFDRVSRVMQGQIESPNEKGFGAGEMTDLIYAWGGSLDDWAYGAGWDTSQGALTQYCAPQTYQPYVNDEYFTNIDHIKAGLYIIEASKNKDPPNNEYGSDDDIFWKDCPGEGWIPRHLRMVISYIDLLQPYIVVGKPKYFPERNEVEISWVLNGCITIDEMSIEVKAPGSPEFTSESQLSAQKGFWNWEGKQSRFSYLVPIQSNEDSEQEIQFRFRFKADQNFGEQQNPDPPMAPVSYISKLRLEENYTFEKGHKITNNPEAKTYSTIVKPDGTVKFYQVHIESDEYLNSNRVSQ